MYTSDAERMALVSHGSSFLSGSANNNALKLWQSQGWQSPAMFRRSEGVCDTADWFQSLRRAGVKRLWYVTFAWDPQVLPKRHAVISAGASASAIQVDYLDGYELWYPCSQMWQVAHKSLLSQQPQAMMLDVEAARSDLRQKLEAAADWEEKKFQEASRWASQFRAAAKLLTTTLPQPPFYANLLPPSILSTRNLSFTRNKGETNDRRLFGIAGFHPHRSHSQVYS